MKIEKIIDTMVLLVGLLFFYLIIEAVYQYAKTDEILNIKIAMGNFNALVWWLVAMLYKRDLK